MINRFLWGCVLWGSVLLLTNCTNITTDFSLADFSTERLKSISLPFDFQKDLGDPFRLTVYSSEILLAVESEKEKQVSVMNLQSGALEEFIYQGNGPTEVLAAWDFGFKNGTPFLTDAGRGRLLFLEDIGMPSRSVRKALDIPEHLLYMAIIGTRNGFVAMSIQSDCRFDILDDDGKSIKKIPFPKGYESGDFEPNNDMFQSIAKYSTARDRIVIVCFSAPYIDIFEGNGSLVSHLNGPIPFTSVFKNVHRGEISYRVQIPEKSIFSSLSVGDDFFMVGYSNEEMTGPQSKIHTILSFDLDGMPCKKYPLPETLSQFDVDWENNIIYGIPNAGEPRIVAYHFDLP